MNAMDLRNCCLPAFFVLVGLVGLSCHKNSVAPDWQFSGGIIFEVAGVGISVINPAEAAPTTHLLVSHGGDPCVSPDDQKLLFSRLSGSTTDLFVSNLDGANVINLTNTGSDFFERHADWAPDMQHVAAQAHFFPTDKIALRVISTDGSGRFTDLTDTARVHQVNFPRYAPDGTKIAYIAEDSLNAPSQLTIISSDGTGERRYGNCLWGPAPLWSPDGKLIAYSDGTDFKFRVLELASGQVIQVDPTVSGASDALWLSTTRLMYTTYDGKVKVSTITPPVATEQTIIASGFQSVQALVLSPHNDQVAFFARQDGESAFGLYLMALDGSNLRRVATVDSSPQTGFNQKSYIHWVE